MESNIRKMYFVQFLKHLMFFSAVSVPFLQQWGGLDFGRILFLQSWFAFWIFLLEVPTGVVADKFGRRTSILLGIFTAVLAALIYGLVPNYYAFLAAEFLWALGHTFMSGADKALIYDSLKDKNKSKAVFANYSIMYTTAFMIAGPIGSTIAKYFPINYPMLFTALPIASSLLIAITLKEPKVQKKLDEAKYFRMSFEGIKYMFTHKRLRSLAVNNAFFGLITYYVLWLWQPMVNKGGLDILYYGFVSFAMNLFGIAVTKNTGKLERIFGEKLTLLLLGVTPGVFFLFSSFTKNIWLLISSILFIMGVWQARTSLMSSYMNEHIESHNRATVNSAVSMSATFLIIITNLFFGRLVDYSLDIALLTLGIFGIAFNIFSRP